MYKCTDTKYMYQNTYNFWRAKCQLISQARDWEQLRERVRAIAFDFSEVHASKLTHLRDIPSALWDER